MTELVSDSPPNGRGRRRGRLAATLAVLGGLTLSLALLQTLRTGERVRLRAEFQRQAAALTTAIRSGCERALVSIRSAGALFAASEAVTPEEFARLASLAVRDDPAVQTLAWVPAADAATPGPERFEVAYVAPAEGNEELLGFDLGSEPQRRAALGKARITGRAAATGRIRLLKAGAPGLLVVLPVPRADDDEVARGASLRGFVAAELLLDSLVRGALQGLDTADLRLVIREPATAEEPPLLTTGDEPGPEVGDAGLDWSVSTEVADRRWTLSVRATPSYLARRRTWAPPAALAAALSLTAIVALFLFRSGDRADKVERLVRERTAELGRVNQLLAGEIAERQRVEEEVRVLNQELARRVLERTAQLEAAHKTLSEQVAERRRTEAALRESEEQFRAVSERALDAILILDGASGRILRANPSAQQALGYPLETLAGKQFSVLFPEGPGPPREEMLEQLRVHGAAFQEQAFRRADGTDVPMDVTATIVPWGEGHAIVATLRDVSERAEAHRAMHEREELARQAQKMDAVGRLAGGVAHDFNNLLMVVGGYADILLRRLSSGDPLRKPAEEIRRAAERATALTRQLLSFGRKQVVQPRVLDLNVLVAEMEGMLRRAVGEDVELRTRLDAEGAWVRTDLGQMEQVMLNLAVNARDAMPGGGRLTVETAIVRMDGDAAVPAGSYVELSVGDTGSGIAPEHRELIFEPFFTTKATGKGAGLGLATVYGIVQQWGGHVRVESEVGRGTTFRVLLPRAEAPPPAAPGASPPAEATSRASETILLVEDEPAVRELAREILEADGYRVLESRDADEAVRFCQRPGPIHLLLTDVVMPGVSGRELALRLRALRPGLKVLFMSGYTDDEVLRRGVSEGAAFLQKPFGPDTLTGKVRDVLDSA